MTEPSRWSQPPRRRTRNTAPPATGAGERPRHTRYSSGTPPRTPVGRDERSPLFDPIPPRSRARQTADAAPSPRYLPPLDEAPRRRLSETERQALRERRRSAPPLDGSWDVAGSRDRTGPRTQDQPRPSLPDLPEESPARDRPSGRAVVLGALLFLGLVAVTIGAGGMLGSDDPEPTPTATLAPTVLPPLGAATEPPNPTTVAATNASRVGRWPGEGDGRAVVCLDPGHGGWDLGYTRVAYAGLPAMAEADYTLAQAYDLKARLEARGFVVVMTRRTPNAVNADGRDVNGDGETIADSVRAGELDEMQARINICNEAKADLLVSMHINGFDRPSPTAVGYETWYTGSRPFGEQSKRFATLAFRALGEEMQAAGYPAVAREINDDTVVSVDDSDPALADNMIMTGPDVPGLIEASEMPGAIVEALFISNDADAAFLASEAGHEAIVSAYEAAIVQYFNEFPE